MIEIIKGFKLIRNADLQDAQKKVKANPDDELAPRRVKELHKKHAAENVFQALVALKAAKATGGDVKFAQNRVDHALKVSKELEDK